LVVDHYRDEATGVLGRDDRGRMSITAVTLRPAATFSGEPQPDAAALADLHHRAHEACYVANSIRGTVTVEPR
jgi:organic hydroperoxide reductase OsmC/OhrA